MNHLLISLTTCRGAFVPKILENYTIDLAIADPQLSKAGPLLGPNEEGQLDNFNNFSTQAAEKLTKSG